MQREQAVEEVTALKDLLLVWINDTPAKRYGRKFKLDFSNPSSRSAYETVINNFCTSRASYVGEAWMRYLIAGGVFSTVGRPLMPGNFDAVKMAYGKFDVLKDGLMYELEDDFERTLRTIHPGGRESGRLVALSDDFYTQITTALNRRFEKNTWDMLI